MLGLSPESPWQPVLLIGAAAFALGSIGVLSWPLHLRTNRVKVATLFVHPARVLRLIEPSHIIIFGLVIALAGAIWQWRKPTMVNPRVAQLENQLAGLRVEHAEQSLPNAPQSKSLIPPTPPPSPPLSAYEVGKKLPVVDAFLTILQDDMQITIDDGPRLQSDWWNALKANTPPNYWEQLLAYRDKIKVDLDRIEVLRGKNPQYQDIIVAAQPTYWNVVLPKVEKFLTAYQYVSTSMKPDASREALVFVMDDAENGLRKAIQDFTEWRNTARSRLIEIRTKISP
jgi:hypothetical protein